MDCDTVVVIMLLTAFGMPVIESTADFAGPGRGEYGIDVIALGRDSEVNESPAYGIRHRGGYHFNERFQLEALIDGALDHDGLCSSALLVAGVVHFRPQRRVEPYLALGMGQASREIETPATDEIDIGMTWRMGS